MGDPGPTGCSAGTALSQGGQHWGHWLDWGDWLYWREKAGCTDGAHWLYWWGALAVPVSSMDCTGGEHWLYWWAAPSPACAQQRGRGSNSGDMWQRCQELHGRVPLPCSTFPFGFSFPFRPHDLMGFIPEYQGCAKPRGPGACTPAARGSHPIAGNCFPRQPHRVTFTPLHYTYQN